MIHQRGACTTIAVHKVHHARRQVCLLKNLRQLHRRQRRCLGRLEHHGVAAGQRRRDLPGRHQQREVPRDHLARHAERCDLRATEGILQLVGPARVVEEVGRSERQVYIPRLLDRLAAVHRLQNRQLSGMLLQQAGDAVEILRTLRRRQLRPVLLVATPRRLHCRIDLRRAPLTELGQLLLGRRIARTEVALRRGELAVDEVAVPLLEPHMISRLERRLILPAWGSRRGRLGGLFLGRHGSAQRVVAK